VIVNVANLEDPNDSNFAKETTSTNNNYGIRYDYGSVMHYADTDFSVNGQPVLVATLDVAWQRTMGNSRAPSFPDIKAMNTHYSCASRCSTPPTCYFGGIANSKDCAQCLCPPGLSGTQCQYYNQGSYAPPNVPNQCTGNYLGATTTPQTLTGVVGTTSTGSQTSGSPPVYTYDSASCHWYIVAQPGYDLVLKVQEVGDYCSTGCGWGNIEIRAIGSGATQVNFDQTGIR
jgi:hypothetical protein